MARQKTKGGFYKVGETITLDRHVLPREGLAKFEVMGHTDTAVLLFGSYKDGSTKITPIRGLPGPVENLTIWALTDEKGGPDGVLCETPTGRSGPKLTDKQFEAFCKALNAS